jgi:hypothetical protein
MILLALAAVAEPPLPALGDGCAPKGDEIVVCRRRDAGERFRLPLRDQGFDPDGPIDSVSRERHRLIDADGGAPDYTRGSCSAVGASGATGCTVKGWREGEQRHGR